MERGGEEGEEPQGRAFATSRVPIAMAVVGRVSAPGLKTSPCEGGGWGREEEGRRGSVLTRSDKFRVGDANRGDPARGEREKEGVVAALSYHRRYAIRWTQRRWLVVKQWEWMQRKRASLQSSPLPCSHGSEIVCGAIYGRCTMHDISHTRGQCNTTCEESEAEDNEIASMVPTLRALSLLLSLSAVSS